MSNNPFADWSKMFGDFKTPAVDFNQVISYYRRNAETGSAAMQLAVESVQAIARRQAEIIRSNAEQAMKVSKEIIGNASPENATAKQADFAKNMLEYNVNSAREIAEMSAKSAQEAFDLINKRIAEQVKEFSDVASTASQATKKKAA